ncbi:MAG: hypothetical protein VW057_11875 [Rhodospirillaceae bacterium]
MSAEQQPLVIIPVLAGAGGVEDMLRPIRDRSSFQRTIEAALTELAEAMVVVTTDDAKVTAAVEALGHPRLRAHSRNIIPYTSAVSAVADDYGAEIIVILEPTHPFRPAGLIARTVANLLDRDDLDSVVCVRRFKANLWQAREGGLIDALGPGGNRTVPTYYQELVGLGLATRRGVLAKGQRLGDAVGFELVDQIWGLVDIHDASSLTLAEALADHFAQLEDHVK